MASTAFKLNHLITKIVYHAVDLLDHGLRQHLHFNADFYRGYWSSAYKIARIGDGGLTRDNFAEGSIATPGGNAAACVLNV